MYDDGEMSKMGIITKENNYFDLVKKTEKPIVIYGAGIIGRAVICAISSMGEDIKNKIEKIVVSDVTFNPYDIEGIPVCSYYDEINFCKSALVLVCVRDRVRSEVIDNLKNTGVHNYIIIHMKETIELLKNLFIDQYNIIAKKFAHCNTNELSEEEYLMFLIKELRQGYFEFEVNLADHCNLNCQCCNHFSPIAKETYLDINEYRKDIKRVAKITRGNVSSLLLLGGEPLLYNDICEVMVISRKELPNADITIVTNGVLLPKMNETFWICCRDNKVNINYTKYPIKIDYEECIKIAKEYGVRIVCTHDSIVEKTTYRLPIHKTLDMDPYRNYMKCYHANKCVVLREGRVYCCPIGANIHHLNNYFNLDLPEKNKNSKSIYEIETLDELNDFLKLPCKLCGYCNVFGYEYDLPWACSKKDIYEWVEREN